MTLQLILIILASLAAAAVIGFAVLLFIVFNPTPPKVQAYGVKVACVGDSITYGPLNKRKINSYPAQLQSLLGDQYQVLNYGHGGRTLLKTGDSPYWTSTMFPASHKSTPDLVLIMLGTNDSKPQNWKPDDFETQLAEFVATYRDLSSCPAIFLMTPPAAFKRAGKKEVIFKVNDEIIANEIVPFVKRVAAQMELPTIDIFSATRDHPEYFKEGVHPNTAGYGVIARKIFNALQKS